MATQQKIRIKLKSYDHNLIDKSAEKIIRTAKSTGAIISGPIPLPTKRTVYTVLRSPFIDKKSREQFQTKVHKRVVDIVNSTPKTVESLMKLDLPSGVDIEIKIYNPRNVNYSEFKSKTIGKNILVVGHSNTIPGFANSLIGEDIYAQIDDRNNSNLYIITICNEKIHHKVLYIK